MCDPMSCPSNGARTAETFETSQDPASSERGETSQLPGGRAWRKIEGRFRLWSFRVYYAKTFANEVDPVLRFAKALIASCQPIHDRQLVIAWNRQRLERYRRKKAREQKLHADA
ncbi:MAG: hypothetical protein IT442_18085 [Phycisphaeraceae bacterium]|nr:hypothetical protein [Phycisphaeraceae bacterium]